MVEWVEKLGRKSDPPHGRIQWDEVIVDTVRRRGGAKGAKRKRSACVRRASSRENQCRRIRRGVRRSRLRPLPCRLVSQVPRTRRRPPNRPASGEERLATATGSVSSAVLGTTTVRRPSATAVVMASVRRWRRKLRTGDQGGGGDQFTRRAAYHFGSTLLRRLEGTSFV